MDANKAQNADFWPANTPVFEDASWPVRVGGITSLRNAVVDRVIAPLVGVSGSHRPHRLLLLGAVRRVGRQIPLYHIRRDYYYESK